MANSKQEILDQIAALQAEADGIDDGDYDVWVKDPESGHETKLSGSHGKKWLQKLGIVDPDPEPEETGNGDGDGEKPPAGKKPATGQPKDKSPVRKGYLS